MAVLPVSEIFCKMKKLFIWVILIGLVCRAAGQETAVEHLKVAMKLNEKKEFESSLLFCNRALDLNPEMSSAWFLRGFNNYSLANYEDAIVDFTVALNFEPGYAEAWFYRGKSKQENGDLWSALKDLNKARELDPSRSAFLLVRSVFASIFGGSGKDKKQDEAPATSE